jgi:hypothetical protein
MKKHLISPSEVIVAGRPMGENIDESRLLAYITEAETMYIKPVLGDKLFHSLLADENDENEQYAQLLNGGAYNVGADIFSFVGLKTTIAYYVFAKNVMVGDFQPTRYGMVMKESDYSSHISTAERSSCYNDTLEVANTYLQDCINYCRRIGILNGDVGRASASGGIKIRKIG